MTALGLTLLVALRVSDGAVEEPRPPVVDGGPVSPDAGRPRPRTLVLRSNPDGPCAANNVVSPAEGEDGHRAAVRLTPPGYPFTVTAVRYTLAHTGKCSAQLAHRAEVYAGTGPAPPAAPTPHAAFTVAAAGERDATARLISLKLPVPLTLARGEHLFVAIELKRPATGPMSCVALCRLPATDDRDFWSNAPAAPYSWQTLTSFGIPQSLAVEADGHLDPPD